MKLKHLVPLLLLLGCTTTSQNDIEVLKAEIMQVEKDFNDMAKEKGLAAAFAEFAAEDGVIKRREGLIAGRTAIAEWYKQNSDPRESLTWKPNFIDVSASGDLAYTYGDFVYTYPDSTGSDQVLEGVFHTVWKRQTDGQWKFVWD